MRRLNVRLGALLVGVAAIAVALLIVVVVETAAVARADSAVTAHVDPLLAASSRLTSDLQAEATAQVAYLQTGEPSLASTFKARARSTAAALSSSRPLATEFPGVRGRLHVVIVSYQGWVAIAIRENNLYATQGPAAPVPLIPVANAKLESLDLDASAFTSSVESLRRQEVMSATAHQHAALAATAGGGTALVLLLGLLAVVLVAGVARPATALQAAAARLTGGDLQTPIRVQSSSELGEIAKDLEGLRERLANRLGALDRLRDMAQQLLAAGDVQTLAEAALVALQREAGVSSLALGVTGSTGSLHLRGLAGFTRRRPRAFFLRADKSIQELLARAELRRGQPLWLEDAITNPLPPSLTALADGLGIRGCALLPLDFRGSFIGLAALFWDTPHRPAAEEQALLELASNELAGAVSAIVRYEETEQAAAEAQAVFYAIADGVVLVDRDGVIRAMNTALQTLSGWPERDALGRPAEEVLQIVDAHDEVLSGAAEPIGRALRGEDPVWDPEASLSLVARDGRRVPVALSAAPIRDTDERAHGAVGVIRDVAQERAIDELKDALISTVSHELRTPLTLVHGFAELLVTRETTPERRKAAAAEILQASRRLARLIDDLLSVSRIDSGHMVLDYRSVALAPLVERTLSGFRALGDQHTLRTSVPTDLPNVWADPDKVEQILTNLVGNSIKYSPSGSVVAVSAGIEGNFVSVEVRDQGIGMSDRDMARLFEKFYRVDRDEVRRTSGTGLGLYITRRLVEMQSGRITVRSRVGVGTTFAFTLPAVPGELPGGAGVQPNRTAAQPAGTRAPSGTATG